MMNRLIPLILLIFVSCSTIKPVPVETIINYKDSTIVNVVDSTVYIPVERIVDVVAQYDTLKLETNKAKATAYVDTTLHILKGSIENKTGVEYKYIYRDRIEYRDSIVAQQIPIPVEVVKTVHPKYEKWLWLFVIAGAALIALYLYKNTNISRWIAGMMKIK